MPQVGSQYKFVYIMYELLENKTIFRGNRRFWKYLDPYHHHHHHQKERKPNKQINEYIIIEIQPIFYLIMRDLSFSLYHIWYQVVKEGEALTKTKLTALLGIVWRVKEKPAISKMTWNNSFNLNYREQACNMGKVDSHTLEYVFSFSF